MYRRNFPRGYIIDYEFDSFNVLKPRLSHERQQLEYIYAMNAPYEFQLTFVRWLWTYNESDEPRNEFMVVFMAASQWLYY